MRSFFARFDEKHNFWENFEKILKFFDENYIENGIFYFFENFFTKNRAFGNSTIFSTTVFPVFWGVGNFPLATPLRSVIGAGKAGHREPSLPLNVKIL